MPLCNICPHQCNVNRESNYGFCNSSNIIKVAQAQLHFYEEPCISGSKGSGTIFFSNCNLKCCFCQNYRISHEGYGKQIINDKFKNLILTLQDKGAHNINLVSPTPYFNLLIDSISNLKKNNLLKIPVIWNSNAYEKTDTIKKLNNIIDIYLPDLKYSNDNLALKFSGINNYFINASNAILEMRSQINTDKFNSDGIMEKGLIIRHLVLPNQIEDSKMILSWIKNNLGPKTLVSLMAQYYPIYKADNYNEINRKLYSSEYNEISEYLFNLGFEDGFIQALSSAESYYTPDFKLEGL